MASLGIRCSNSDYTYVLLDGTRDNPRILESGRAVAPKGFGRVEVITWMIQEIQRIMDGHNPSHITMRASERISANKAFEQRVEMEAAVYAAAGSRGFKAVFKKRRSTIAKDLGLKGRARYLSANLDTSVIPEFQELPTKTQDAVLAAWSEL